MSNRISVPALTLGALVMLCRPSPAQSPAQSKDSPPQFEIAAVTALPASRGPNMSGGLGLRGDRLSIRNATMVDLIRLAYGFNPDQVIGGPPWLEWSRFDVQGKAAPETPPAAAGLMLQGLLADRFKLAVRKDTRPLPLYVLSEASGKAKLKASDGTGKGCMSQALKPGTPPGASISCRNTTMQQLAQLIRSAGADYLRDSIRDPAGRVEDKTGVQGSWDFDLHWTNLGQLKNAGPDGISLYDAIDKQLGLKLERKIAPTPLVVVESVNQTPAPNPPGAETALKRLTGVDVATIKPSAPGAPKRARSQNDRIGLEAYTLSDLILYAWNIDPAVADRVVAGLPKFAAATPFDVQAKASQPFEDLDELRTVLQGLLMDRFKLKVHTEDRPVETFVLTAGKPKLKPAQDPSARTKCTPAPGRDPDLTCQNMSMAEFAVILIGDRGTVDLPVLDATGIEGRWDFHLNYILAGNLRTITQGQAAGDAPTPAGGLSLVEAVDKQLGLKMELRKRPFPVLVIDHVEEHPSEN